jgi:hypothetical protein
MFEDQMYGTAKTLNEVTGYFRRNDDEMMTQQPLVIAHVLEVDD